MVQDTHVIRLLDAAQELARITRAEDAISLIRYAEAARVYARQAELGAEAENAATAIRLKAEIRLAEIVSEGQRRGEIAQQGVSPKVATSDLSPATYRDLGVRKQQVHGARQIAAAFGPADIDAMAEAATARGESMSRASVIREAQRVAIDASERELDDVTPRQEERNRDRDIAQARSLIHELLPLLERVAPYLSADDRRTIVAQLITARRLVGGLERMEVIDGRTG
jgi:hypothetical protein